jgi:ABC-2 type transport system ATP-binding protein
MQATGLWGTLPFVEAGHAIRARGVTKRFGDTLAVNDLDLEVPRGMFYGLLGPNGAGKTTSIGMLTGTLRPTAGRIELFGRFLDSDDPWFKERMGVVAEEPALFSRLKGREQLVFTARMFGLGPEESAKRSRELLSLLKLSGDADTLIADYSRGMRKKLAIGCALIHAPTLLFFDEPFEGVDALSAETIRGVLSGLCGRGATVLLTTHILEVAEKICQRVGIINRGKLAFEADMQDLQREGQHLSEVFRRVVGLSGPGESFPQLLVGK